MGIKLFSPQTQLQDGNNNNSNNNNSNNNNSNNNNNNDTRMDLLNDIVGGIGVSHLKRNKKNDNGIRNCIILRCLELNLIETLKKSYIISYFTKNAAKNHFNFSNC